MAWKLLLIMLYADTLVAGVFGFIEFLNPVKFFNYKSDKPNNPIHSKSNHHDAKPTTSISATIGDECFSDQTGRETV